MTQNDDRFTFQCQEYLDGRMSAQEKTEFLADLEANSERKRLFLAYFALHGRLNELPVLAPSVEFEARLLETLSTAVTTPEGPTQVVPLKKPTVSWINQRRWQATAAAVLLFVMVGIGFKDRLFPSPQYMSPEIQYGQLGPESPEMAWNPMDQGMNDDAQLSEHLMAFWTQSEQEALEDDAWISSMTDLGEAAMLLNDGSWSPAPAISG